MKNIRLLTISGGDPVQEIIRTIDLKKTYGSGESAVHALKPCNIAIGKGETVAVMGASGSGKSTLLHLLGGLDLPSGGSVLFNGENVYQKNDRDLSVFRRRNIGFVFQSYNLVPELTAMENIMLPALLDCKKTDREFLEQIVETLNLQGRMDHLPGALSGGQQQRVAIARAVVGKPSLLLCDEPTGNLDTQSGNEVLGLLEMLSNQLGITLVVVTHDPDLARHMGRTITISDGQVGGGLDER